MMDPRLSLSDLSHAGSANPVTAQPASFEAWQALVAPGDVFRHPRDVLAHPALSRAEKRAVLASWVSDVHALENAPGLRCLTGSRAEPVSVDAVLAALAELDDGSSREQTSSTPVRAVARRRSSPLSRLRHLRRYVRPRRRDDDDDPPPCPATIVPRPRTPPSPAALAVCA